MSGGRAQLGWYEPLDRLYDKLEWQVYRPDQTRDLWEGKRARIPFGVACNHQGLVQDSSNFNKPYAL